MEEPASPSLGPDSPVISRAAARAHTCPGLSQGLDQSFRSCRLGKSYLFDDASDPTMSRQASPDNAGVEATGSTSVGPRATSSPSRQGVGGVFGRSKSYHGRASTTGSTADIMLRLENIFAAAPAQIRQRPQVKRMHSWKQRSLNNLSFSDPLLFRGTRPSSVLHQFASVMGGQPCTSEFWGFSEPVSHIGTFISHNWSTPRQQKYLALVLYFNMLPAVVCGAAAALAAFALTLAEWLPRTEEVALRNLGEATAQLGASEETARYQSAAVWCVISYAAVFLFVLFFFHEFSRLFGYRGPAVFLDKYCVHQTDTELKRKGIESLAAFLFYSWDALVLYSDMYLQKLWTVYEIASFIMLHPQGQVNIWPLFLPKAVLAGFVIVSTNRVFSFAVRSRYVQDQFASDSQEIVARMFTSSVLLCSFVLASWLFHTWAKEQAKVARRVSAFRLQSAACFSEDDRVVVQRNIVGFMKYFCLVHELASDQEVYEEFEMLVKQEVPNMLQASFGRAGIKYQLVVVTLSPAIIGGTLDDLASLLFRRTPMLEVLEQQIWYVGEQCFALPLVFAMMMQLSGSLVAACQRCAAGKRPSSEAEVGGARSVLCVIGAAIPGLIVFCCMHSVQNFVHGRVVLEDSWAAWFAVQVGVSGSLGLVTYMVYRPTDRKRYRRRLELDEDGQVEMPNRPRSRDDEDEDDGDDAPWSPARGRTPIDEEEEQEPQKAEEPPDAPSDDQDLQAGRRNQYDGDSEGQESI